jgi:hypothetical protein
VGVLSVGKPGNRLRPRDLVQRRRSRASPFLPGPVGDGTPSPEPLLLIRQGSQAQHDLIQIDSTATGYGWFVDETPADDLEFTIVAGPNQFGAPSDTAAHGRVDLLTAVMHELGHVLGWGHAEEDELMGETLSPGVRQTIDVLLAETDEAGLDAVFEQSSLSHEEVDLAFASLLA